MSPSMNLETGSVISVTFLLASESGRHSTFWASCRSDCSNLQLLRILLPMPQRKCVMSILGNNVMMRIFSGIISPGSVLGGYFTGSLADYIHVKCIKFGFISLWLQVLYKELGTSDGFLESDVNGLEVYGELFKCREDQVCQLQPKKVSNTSNWISIPWAFAAYSSWPFSTSSKVAFKLSQFSRILSIAVCLTVQWVGHGVLKDFPVALSPLLNGSCWLSVLKSVLLLGENFISFPSSNTRLKMFQMRSTFSTLLVHTS